MATPQAILDALTATQTAKDAADAAVLTKQNTATAVTAAQTADVAAATDLANKTAALNTARQQLEAIEDAYFAPGAAAPVSGS
jgi:hypothetical protein